MKKKTGPENARATCLARRTNLRPGRVAGVALLTPLALLLAPRVHAQGATIHEGRVGVVAEVDVDYGGDDVFAVFPDGQRSKVSAGQGMTLSVGAHYKPLELPVDFTATVGYKFIGIDDRNSNLGFYRYVFKVTATYELPHFFYVDAGPVVNTDIKLRGDGLVADVPFGDSAGVTMGVGWRFVGVSYTYIRYTSNRPSMDVDGSNIGVNFTFKF